MLSVLSSFTEHSQITAWDVLGGPRRGAASGTLARGHGQAGRGPHAGPQEDVERCVSHEWRAVVTGSLGYNHLFCASILNSEEMYLPRIVISMLLHEKLKLNIRVTTRRQLGSHGRKSSFQVPDECQSYSLATAASLHPLPV